MRDETKTSSELLLIIKNMEKKYEELCDRYKKLQLENIQEIIINLRNKKNTIIEEIIEEI